MTSKRRIGIIGTGGLPIPPINKTYVPYPPRIEDNCYTKMVFLVDGDKHVKVYQGNLLLPELPDYIAVEFYLPLCKEIILTNISRYKKVDNYHSIYIKFVINENKVHKV